MTMKERRSRVVLNISGEIFETWEDTLSRFPDTLLGRKKARSIYYCPITRQHFFDRNRYCFDAILYFYQSNGSLKCPLNVPTHVFEAECRFFNLPDKIITKMKEQEGIIVDEFTAADNIKHMPLQTRIFNIIENPETSMYAWGFGMFSLTVTWFSIFCACFDTLPEFHVHSTVLHKDYWSIIELALNTWFLTELVLRLSFSPSKMKFLFSTMNMLDIISIVPYFILLAVHTSRIRIQGIFKTFRFMRVGRLFRLTKHSTRLKVLCRIIQISVHTFQLVVHCLVIVVCVGSTVMYCIECNDPDCGFTSIPASFWWSITTITSIGYGDLIPVTICGRLFACCFMIIGTLAVSLPISTIVYQCTTLYPKNVYQSNN